MLGIVRKNILICVLIIEAIKREINYTIFKPFEKKMNKENSINSSKVKKKKKGDGEKKQPERHGKQKR